MKNPCEARKIKASQNLHKIISTQLVDITNISDVKQGDIAVIIGRSGDNEIKVYDLAEQTGTITNEVLSRLGTRLERKLL